MWYEIAWSEESESHIARHDVSPGEVEECINSRPNMTLRGPHARTLVFGVTRAGRFLLVVLSDAADGRTRVVTSRDMTGREKRVFRREAN